MTEKEEVVLVLVNMVVIGVVVGIAVRGRAPRRWARRPGGGKGGWGC